MATHESLSGTCPSAYLLIDQTENPTAFGGSVLAGRTCAHRFKSDRASGFASDELLAQLCRRHDLVMLTTDRDFELMASHVDLRLWSS